MKKILLIVIIVVFVPFLIVNSYKIQKVKEIKLNYESNYFIRVKRTSTNEIQNIPFEEYIVGVLAGEMPISFEKEEEDEENKKYLHRERKSYSKVSRSFYLGDIDEEDIDASFKNGILVVSAPKKKEIETKKTISIKDSE